MSDNLNKELVCICHFGGEIRLSAGKITYRGGHSKAIVVNVGMTYEECLHELSTGLEIDLVEKHLLYSSKFKKDQLLQLSNNSTLKAMFRLNDETVDVYVKNECGTDETLSFLPSQPISSRASTSPFQHLLDNTSSVGVMESFENLGEDVLVNSVSTAVVENLETVGQLFESPDAFKLSVHEFALRNHFGFKSLNCSRNYYRMVCVVEGCPWKVTAGCEGKSDIVRVKSFNNVHSHTAQDLSTMKLNIRPKQLAKLVVSKCIESPQYPPREMGNDLQKKFSINMSYMQMWRTKEVAKQVIDGRPEDGYLMVPFYCDRIVECMPGSVVELNTTSEQKFKQLFVAYECSIRGFEHCRPLLSIDACHLSGNFRGTLLGATAYDADNGLYPFAYGIVSVENDENWNWFLRKVKEIVKDRVITILTDRHPSLISGVRQVFGSHCHAWCVRHLTENYMKYINGHSNLKIRGAMKDTAKTLLNNIAHSRTMMDYNKAMRELNTFRSELHQWVLNNSPEHWCDALLVARRWDKYSTNQAESFNAWVMKERRLSSNLFVQEHFKHCTKFLYMKKGEMEKWNVPVGPLTDKKIQDNLTKGLAYDCVRAGNTHFSVDDKKRGMYRVVLGEGAYCTCREWEMSGIPCPHACRAIKDCSMDVYDCVEPYFRLEKQRDIYDRTMCPMVTHDLPHPSEVANAIQSSSSSGVESSYPHVRPPVQSRPPGRPRVKRIESQFQNKNVSRCSRCHEPGHNRSTCKNPLPRY